MGLPNGVHTWQVRCVDDSLNYNNGTSPIWEFTVGADTTGPVITLVDPPNNFKDTDGSFTVTYNADDFLGGIDNCSIYINGTYNRSNTSVIIEGVDTTLTIPNMPEGKYGWVIECYDDSPAKNPTTTSSRVVTVDYDFDNPIVELISPGDLFQSVSGNIDFKYNVTDENDIDNCSLLIN
jgi:hypothetical protein